MNCPSCNKKTSSGYKVENLCKNKECDLYLKDDVTNLVNITNSSPSQNSRRDTTNSIDYILNNFNFAKVEKCMLAMQWKWGSLGRVPNVKELSEKAYNLLEKCQRYLIDNPSNDEWSVMTGGLCAKALKEDGKIYLELQFILESWDTYE